MEHWDRLSWYGQNKMLNGMHFNYYICLDGLSFHVCGHPKNTPTATLKIVVSNSNPAT